VLALGLGAIHARWVIDARQLYEDLGVTVRSSTPLHARLGHPEPFTFLSSVSIVLTSVSCRSAEAASLRRVSL